MRFLPLGSLYSREEGPGTQHKTHTPAVLGWLVLAEMGNKAVPGRGHRERAYHGWEWIQE